MLQANPVLVLASVMLRSEGEGLPAPPPLYLVLTTVLRQLLVFD